MGYVFSLSFEFLSHWLYFLFPAHSPSLWLFHDDYTSLSSWICLSILYSDHLWFLPEYPNIWESFWVWISGFLFQPTSIHKGLFPSVFLMLICNCVILFLDISGSLRTLSSRMCFVYISKKGKCPFRFTPSQGLWMTASDLMESHIQLPGNPTTETDLCKPQPTSWFSASPRKLLAVDHCGPFVVTSCLQCPNHSDSTPAL